MVKPIPKIISEIDNKYNKNKKLSIEVSSETINGRTYKIKTYTKDHDIWWKIRKGIVAFFATIGTGIFSVFISKSIQNLWLEAVSGKTIYIIKKEQKSPQNKNIETIFQKAQDDQPQKVEEKTANIPPSVLHNPAVPLVQEIQTPKEQEEEILKKADIIQELTTPEIPVETTIRQQEEKPTIPTIPFHATNEILPANLSKNEAKATLNAADTKTFIDEVDAYGDNEIEFLQQVYKDLKELAHFCKDLNYSFDNDKATEALMGFSQQHLIEVKPYAGDKKDNQIAFIFRGADNAHKVNHKLMDKFKDSSGKRREIRMTQCRDSLCTLELIKRNFKGVFEVVGSGQARNYWAYFEVIKPV